MAATKRKTPPEGTKAKAPSKRKAQPKDRTFYANTLLFTFERLGLSQNAIQLLKLLDEMQQGSITENELGRKIRLSPAFSKALTDTITLCTDTMIEDPSEAGECAVIIKKCNGMRKISGICISPFPKTIMLYNAN